MTVFELIQELVNWQPNAIVEIQLPGNNNVDIDGVVARNVSAPCLIASVDEDDMNGWYGE